MGGLRAPSTKRRDKTMMVKEAIQLLKTYDDEETICLIFWTPEDVRTQDPIVSDEKAADVLNAMEENHDANDGITWYTIDNYLAE